MGEDKEQLVDEQAMDKMSVAPPDPGRDARQIEGETAAGEKTGNGRSGVDDQDPLSAHPT